MAVSLHSSVQPVATRFKPSFVASMNSALFNARSPVASTSRIPYTAVAVPPPSSISSTLGKRGLSIGTRSFRLTPVVRTRLTNGSFVLAATLSIVIASLGMSGSIQPGGVTLPCPARSQAGVGAQEFNRANEGGSAAAAQSNWSTGSYESELREARTKSKRRRQWLDDPVPAAATAAVKSSPGSTRTVSVADRNNLGHSVAPTRELEREQEGSREAPGWQAWTKGWWRS